MFCYWLSQILFCGEARSRSRPAGWTRGRLRRSALSWRPPLATSKPVALSPCLARRRSLESRWRNRAGQEKGDIPTECLQFQENCRWPKNWDKNVVNLLHPTRSNYAFHIHKRRLQNEKQSKNLSKSFPLIKGLSTWWVGREPCSNVTMIFGLSFFQARRNIWAEMRTQA